jgi:hypothetical protein
MADYRNPSSGPRQRTNRKIHDAIVNTRLFDGTVSLDLAVDVHAGKRPIGPLNMDRQVCRLLAESAAILLVAHRQEMMLLNADEMKQWSEHLSVISDDDEDGWSPFRPPEYQSLYRDRSAGAKRPRSR